MAGRGSGTRPSRLTSRTRKGTKRRKSCRSAVLTPDHVQERRGVGHTLNLMSQFGGESARFVQRKMKKQDLQGGERRKLKDEDKREGTDRNLERTEGTLKGGGGSV